MTGAPAQRHRLALLALLARAPRNVLSRETLMGFLWPELTTASARQLLNASVHELRKALGDAALVTEAGTLRLDPERVPIDTIEFEAAAAHGDLETAARLYTGSFLEGLALPEAVAFDHWCDGERDGLERAFHATLERLATQSSESGQHLRAVHWWRQRLGRTPGDGRVVVRLMEALAQAGDRAGALQVAESHATLLAREFDAERDPEVDALAGQLRRGEIRASPQPRGGSSPNAPQRGDHGVDEFTPAAKRANTTDPREGDDSTAGTEIGPARPAFELLRFLLLLDSPSGHSKRRVAITIALASLLAIAAFLITRSDNTILAESPLVATRVVVAPFKNESGDSALAILGRLAAHSITDGLTRTLALEVVPTPTAIEAWRFALAEVNADRARDPLRVLAAETRAGIVISGAFFGADQAITFQAQISHAASGRLIAPSVRGTDALTRVGEALENLTQQILGSLAATLGRDTVPLVVALTKPPRYEAYQEFTAGMEHHDQLHFDSAIQHFYRAAALDSSFVIPLLVAGLMHVNVGRHAQADSLANVVAAFSDVLNPVERYNLQHLRAYLRRDWHGQYQASVALYSRGAERFAFNAALASFQMNRPREGIEWLSKLDPDRGPMRRWSPYWEYLALLHHAVGDHYKELRIAKQGRARYPDVRSIQRAELMARAALGQYQQVLLLLDQGRALPEQLGESYLAAAETAAREFFAHGHATHARNILLYTISQIGLPFEELPSPVGSTFQFARVLFYAERFSDARPLFLALLSQDTANIDYLGFLGLTLAREGRRTEAMRISQRLRRFVAPFLFGANTIWRARIAAVAGDRSAAIHLLKTARDQRATGASAFALHTDVSFHDLRRDAAFRQLLSPEE